MQPSINVSYYFLCSKVVPLEYNCIFRCVRLILINYILRCFKRDETVTMEAHPSADFDRPLLNGTWSSRKILNLAHVLLGIAVLASELLYYAVSILMIQNATPKFENEFSK